MTRDNRISSGFRAAAFFERSSLLNKSAALVSAWLMMLCPMITAAEGGSRIVTDGRTNTTVSTSGTTTHIHTQTIQGNNAYNSFKQFDVSKGDTVNLYVPNQASNLINLVHDKQSEIYGTLNSIKNGQIGGNVYLLNPNGVIVGPSGSINTGHLTIQTPTRDFMNSVIGADGPSAAATARILDNTVPVSPGGLVSVSGKINATDGVTVRAGGIDISGRINAGSPAYAAMRNAVNLKGLAPVPTSVTRTASGAIVLGSPGNIKVAGRLDARGEKNIKGGTIRIESGQSIDVESGAVVTARGEGQASDGGDIVIVAGQDARLAQGAQIDVRGGDISGHGGFIEFSAKRRVGLEGGQMDASARNGRDGAIYIDPEFVDYTANTVLSAGLTTVEASGKITVHENVTVSTQTAGDSLIFRAPEIELLSGSKISTVHGSDKGDITLETTNSGDITSRGVITLTGATLEGRTITLLATSSNTGGFGEQAASSTITLRDGTGGTVSRIDGSDVTLTATAVAETSFFNTFDIFSGSGQSVSSQLEDIGAVALNVGFLGLPVKAVVGIADAEAKISIEGASEISSSGTTTLASSAKTLVEAPLIDVTALLDPTRTGNLTIPTVNVIYASTRTTAETRVGAGASITSGGDLSVTAATDVELKTDIVTITNQANAVDIGIAIAESSTQTTAVIENGAGITLNGAAVSDRDVTISADNDAKYRVGTTVMALSSDQNTAALSLNYVDIDEQVMAELGASLAGAGDVSVTATSDISRLKSQSDAAVGNTLLSKVINSGPVTGLANSLTGTIAGKTLGALNIVRNKLGALGSAELPLQLGGSVAILDVEPTVEAKITAGSVLARSVNVASEISIARLQNLSKGEAAGGQGTNTTFALSLPITTIDITNRATIAAGTTITASESVSVSANTDIPYDQQWDKYDGIASVVSKLNGNLGVFNAVLSTEGIAQASGNTADGTTSLGFAGALNLTTLNVETLAQIGGDTDANGTGPAATSVTAKTVSVTTTTDIDLVNGTGNIGGIFSGFSGVSGSTAIGLGFSIISLDTTAKAVIGDNTTVIAAETVDVTADAKEMLVSVGASAQHKGSSDLGVAGAMSINNVDSTTIASIGKDSSVRTTTSGAGDIGDINVSATDELVDWNIAGGVSKAENVGFGASVAVNTINLDTEAVILDASEIRAAKALDVRAYGTGTVGSLALAGGIATTSDPNADPSALSQKWANVKGWAGGKWDSFKGLFSSKTANGGQGTTSANSSSGSADANGSAGGGSNAIAAGIQGAVGAFGVAVAADAAVNVIDIQTKAAVERVDTIAAETISVEAENDLVARAGAGAFTFQSFKDPSQGTKGTLGLAGSFGANLFQRDAVVARIADAGSLTATNALDVNAYTHQLLSSGAASGSAQTAPAIQPGVSGNIAGAVGVNGLVDAETTAEIVNTHVVSGGDISVSALDGTELETGAGALTLTKGTKGLGAGASAGVNMSDADVTARIENTDIDASSSVAIAAEADRDILSIGIGVGIQSGNTTGLTIGGSFAYNSIGGVITSELAAGTVNSSGAATVTAKDESGLITIAGEATSGGSIGLGIAAAASSVHNTAYARVSDATIDTQRLAVEALIDRSSLTLAAGAAVTKDGTSIKGSVAVNLSGNDDDSDGIEGAVAEIAGGSTINVDQDVTVHAADKTDLMSFAGAYEQGKAGAGAAVAINKADGAVTSTIRGSTISGAQTVHVIAVEGATGLADTSGRTQLISVAASMGNNQGPTLSGAAAVNVLSTRTTAEISADALIGSDANRAGAVTVEAADRTVIGSGALGAARGNPSIAGAVTVDLFEKTTTARLAGTTRASGDVVVDAESTQAAYGGLLAIAAGQAGVISIGVGVAEQSNTTLAEIADSADVHTNSNVFVNAEEHGDVIRFSAAAGLVSVQMVNSETTARIGENASVTALAQGTAGQVRTGAMSGGIAPNSSSVSNAGGAGASDGLGSVQDGTGNAVATNIQATNTQDGNGNNDGAENVDATAVIGAQTAETQGVKGVAVTAFSDQRMINLGLGVVIGGSTGVGGAATVSSIEGNTTAEIGRNASVNTGAGIAGTDQDVLVRAEANGLTVDTAVGVVVGGSTSVGAGVDVVLLDKTTEAKIGRGATVDAEKSITVEAENHDMVVSASASIAQGGSTGVAGAVGVTTLDNRAAAYVEDGTSAANRAVLSTRGSLDVHAKNTSDVYHIAGGLGVGGNGIGAGVSVIKSSHDTFASLGDYTKADAFGAMRIAAETDANLFSVTIALGGGNNGVAGGISVKLLETETTAGIGNSAEVNQMAVVDQSLLSGQSLTVEADDETDVLSVVGAGAGGVGVGIGAGLDVAIMKGKSIASIGADAEVSAAQSITIDATLAKDYEGYTVAAGIGGSVGVAGAVSVLKAGGALSAAQSDAMSSGNGSAGGQISSLTSGGNVVSSDALGNGTGSSSAGTAAANAQTSGDVSGHLASSGSVALTTGNDARVEIGTDSTVSAGMDLTATASNITEFNVLTGALGAGVNAGFGAGVAIADIHTLSRIQAGNGAHLSAGRSLSFTANDGDANSSGSIMRSFAGALAGYVAAGAAVADVDWTTTTGVEIGYGVSIIVTPDADPNDSTETGQLTIAANEQNDIEVEVYGATGAGLMAVGGQIALVEKDGTVEVEIDDATTVSNGTALEASTIDIAALHGGELRAEVYGGTAAGAAAVSFILVDVDDDVAVETRIGNRASLSAADAVLLAARSSPDVTARAYGGTAAIGFAMGLTSAEASATITSRLTTGNDVSIASNGTVRLTAEALKSASGTNASTETVAGAGALIGTFQAVSAETELSTTVATTIGNVNTFTIGSIDDNATGTLSILANSDIATETDGRGGAGGIVAIGAVDSKSTVSNTVSINVGTGTRGLVEGGVTVLATGRENLDTETLGGAGGLVAGVSATSTNILTADVRTVFADNATASTITSGALTIAARHLDGRVKAETDSRLGSIIGASGAYARNTGTATVLTSIGDNRTFTSYGQALIEASNQMSKVEDGDSVTSASGGVFDSAAARSTTQFKNAVDVNIGDSIITVADDNSYFTTNDLVVRAYSMTYGRDTARLDSGGAIAIARAESSILSGTSSDRDHTRVNVEGGAELRSDDGDVAIGARTDSDIKTYATAKTYGLAGSAEGEATSRHYVDNSVTIGAGVRVYAEESIKIAAGEDDRAANTMNVVAETRLWNKTLIPMETDPEAHAEANVTSTVTVIGNARINAVRNIEIAANDSGITTYGYGRGQDLWQEVAAAIGNFFRGLVGQEPETIETTYSDSQTHLSTRIDLNNAEVKAGFKHVQELTIARDPVVSSVTNDEGDTISVRNYVAAVDANGNPIQSEGVVFSVRNGISLEDELSAAIVRLTSERDAFGRDLATKQAIQNDIDILQARYNSLLAEAGATPDNLDPLLVDFVDVSNITARSGDVTFRSQVVTGSGLVEAPGDVRITIRNESGAFLKLADLTIPEERGGRIFFNGAIVATNGDIGQRNSPNTATSFTLHSSANQTPVINVENVYGNGATDGRAPDLVAAGDILNGGGSVRLVTNGNLDVSGDIRAATVNLSAGKDFVKSFTYGFFHVGGLPRQQFSALASQHEALAVPSSDTVNLDGQYPGVDFPSANSASSIVAGGDLYISAERLNINGLLQSGLADQTLNLGASYNSVLSAMNAAYAYYALVRASITPSNKTYWKGYFASSVNGNADAKRTFNQLVDSDGTQTTVELTHGDNVMVAGNDASSDASKRFTHMERNLGSSFNLLSGEIEVESAEVRGGTVQLFGDVLSTGGGQINVIDGYGSININNQTNAIISLAKIDTGAGVEGRIRMIDPTVQIADPRGGGGTVAQITEYKRIGDTIKVYTNATLDAQGNPATFVADLATGREAGFTPDPIEERYGWTTGQSESVVTRNVYKKRVGSFFGLGEVDWLAADPDNLYSTNSTRIGDPQPIKTDPDGDGKFDSEAEYYVPGTAGLETYGFSSERINVTSNTEKDGPHRRCVSRFIGCFKYEYTTTVTITDGNQLFYRHSIPADMPVAIGFVGHDIASLTIDSNATIALNSAVTSRTGDTNITSTNGDILARTSAAVVSGEKVNLTANNGMIGGASGAPSLGLDLVDVPSAILNASAGRGVDITEKRGSLTYGNISAGTGNAEIETDLSILQSGTGRIQGRNVALTAHAGTIGTSSQDVNIDTDAATGKLNATAPSDIHLTEVSGNLTVDKITSASGVTLTVSSGNLLDGNDNDVRDQATETELLAIWNDAALLDGADAQASRDASVTAFENKGRSDYDFYWQARGVEPGSSTGSTGNGYDPGYAYSFGANETSQLQAQGYDAGAIQRMADEKTQTYHAMNALLAGGSYDPQYVAAQALVGQYMKDGKVVSASTAGAQYQLNAVDVTKAGQGYAWTAGELDQGIASSLLAARGDTTPVIEDANIEARNLTLNVAAGQIGTTKDTIHIERQADGSPAVLTNEMKIALASAERDDFTFGADFIDLSQREDVDLKVSGNIDVHALSHIFLGAENDNINISRAKSDSQDIRIKTGGSVTNASPGTAVVEGNNLIIESSAGSIGSRGAVLAGNIAGNLTLRAASGDVFFEDRLGNLDLDFAFAGNTAWLKATNGSILDTRNDLDRNILAGAIELDGRNGAGSDASPESRLGVEISSLSGVMIVNSAFGSVAIDGTARDLRIGTVDAAGDVSLAALSGSLQNGTITSGGDVDLRATDDIGLGTVSASGHIVADAATGEITQTDGAVAQSTAGVIYLTAEGDITLAGIATGNATAGAVTVVSANGAIRDGGDATLDIVANAVGAGVNLTAKNGIGPGNALDIQVHTLTVSNSTAGTIEIAEADSLILAGLTQSATAAAYVTTGADLTVQGPASNANGLISLVAGGAVTVDAAIAGAEISLRSDGATDINATLTSNAGDITVDAGSALTYDAAITAAANASLTSGDDMTGNANVTAENGSLSLTSGGTLTETGNLDGETGVTTSSTGNQTITGNATSNASPISLTGGGNVTIDGQVASHGGSITAHAGLDLTLSPDTGLDSDDGDITLIADGAQIAMGTVLQDKGLGFIDAGLGDLEVQGGTIRLLNPITAGNMTFRANGPNGAIELGTINVHSSIDVRANSIILHDLVHTGTSVPLDIVAMGSYRPHAKYIEINATSSVGINFVMLAAIDAKVRARTGLLNFSSASIVRTGRFTNDTFETLIDNRSPAIQATDAQLFQSDPGEVFRLTMKNAYLMTTAHVLQMDRNFLTRIGLPGQGEALMGDTVRDIDGRTLLQALAPMDAMIALQQFILDLDRGDEETVSDIDRSIDHCLANQSVNTVQSALCVQ